MVRLSVACIILVGLLVAGAFVVLPRDEHKQLDCSSVPAATSRDADAQVFVDALEEAEAAIAAGRDGQLYSAASYGDSGAGESGAFYFLREGEPNPTGVLFYDKKGIADVSEIHSPVPEPKPYLKSLDDLTLGPSKAISITQDAYPDFNVYTVSLFRDAGCELAWRVAGTLDEDGEPSLLLIARVRNSDGALTLADGTPRPYENLLEIMFPY